MEMIDLSDLSAKFSVISESQPIRQYPSTPILPLPYGILVSYRIHDSRF